MIMLNPFSLKRSFDEFLNSISVFNTINTKIDKFIKTVPGLRHLQMTGESLSAFIKEKIDNWLITMGRNSYNNNTLKNMNKQKKKAEVYRICMGFPF